MRDTGTSPAIAGLLGPDEPPTFSAVNAGGRAPVLLVCDHASNRLPARLDGLGLSEAERARHIGWDIGAAEVALTLSAALDVPLVLANYSRLAIDPNRAPGEPTSIVEVVDGTVVPGNLDLSPEARAQRCAELHTPYHAAIARALDEFHRRGIDPGFVAVHSFTPELKGRARPWHIGVLWDRDPRLAVPLIARLRAEPGIEVGDNQPYSGRSGYGYTAARHANARSLPDVLIELRQDLIADAVGVRRWASLLARALGDVVPAALAAKTG
jgi:predicted N-formylglutamate amidohydrolase